MHAVAAHARVHHRAGRRPAAGFGGIRIADSRQQSLDARLPPRRVAHVQLHARPLAQCHRGPHKHAPGFVVGADDVAVHVPGASGAVRARRVRLRRRLRRRVRTRGPARLGRVGSHTRHTLGSHTLGHDAPADPGGPPAASPSAVGRVVFFARRKRRKDGGRFRHRRRRRRVGRVVFSPSLRRRIAAAGDGPRPFEPFETVVVAHPEHHRHARDAVRQVGEPFGERVAGGAPVQVQDRPVGARARQRHRRPHWSVRVQTVRLHLEVAHENDAHGAVRRARRGASA